MKTVPPPCPEPDFGPKHWRSLDQLAETPEFRQWVEREFPAGASEFTDPHSRRHFVKIMSASFLLGGLGMTGCRRPEETILPFAKAPANYIHGVPQYYATSMPARGSAVPLVVKSNDGRPTKIEGNGLHPDSNGGTDRYAQASILNLYDPDRAIRHTHSGKAVTAAEVATFLSELSKNSQSNGGEGLCFLLERSSSSSRARVQAAISKKFPKARWFVYEPVDFDIHRQAASVGFGKAVAPYFKFDDAKVIVSLDSDFIGSEQDAHVHIRRFAKGRKVSKPEDTMNRLYAVEGLFTLTGINADHRLRVPTSAVAGVAARLAIEITRQAGKGQLPTAVQHLAEGVSEHEKWIVECAKDLLANKGAGLVVAGHRQPLEVHLLAHAINEALGNNGKTVEFRSVPQSSEGSIAELAVALNAGQVKNLVIVGGNPVYNAPADLDWAATQRKAQTVVRLGYYEDETSSVSDWNLALAHYLESWGDARSSDGTLVPVQPLIEPLFGGLTELEVLARAGGLEKTSAYDIVRETFEAAGGKGENAWNKFLHDGYLAGSASKAESVSFNWSAASTAINGAKPLRKPGKDALEVVFHRDYSMDDGRFNNNGWMQEMPDPVSKIVWDNAVLISRKTASELGLKNDDVVEIELNGRKVSGPIWIQPGFADYSVGLALGYGRSKSGRIGGFKGQSVGFNAYPLRAFAEMHSAVGAKLTKTRKKHQIVCTQDHGLMEGRPIVREANLEQYRKKPDFAKHMGIEAHAPNLGSMYPHPYDKHPETKSKIHQWGMSIDLNSCVGCSACVIACQSENNTPIVGKEQVFKGREMHWLRIDRYYSSDRQDKSHPADDPQANYQPMLCQHCEKAPCESVCPVNATVHDGEGLNVMAYNRCVGTRYCSNNCPYKVRRFNFFDFNKRPIEHLYKGPAAKRPEDEWELLKLARNPDVSVRMRGVMEKCTFCTQRIEQGKIAQKVKAGASGDVQVPDGAIKTACQQACPADAIVFGNLLDPNSRVSQLKKLQRDYSVLGFLDTLPRTTYLAKVRNPNPSMPDYHQSPVSIQEYKDLYHSDPFESHGHGGDKKAQGHNDKKGAH